MNRPNILWISTHDINPDLGCYAGVWPGAEYAITPNLDRLAAEGVRFDNAFAAAPICAPARSAIVTGCFPTAIGTMHMRTKAVPPPEVRLLPEYFRANGYYCTNNVFTDFQVDVPATAFDDCSPTAHWRDRSDPDQPFFAMFHGMATHESQLYLDDDEFLARTPDVTPALRHDPAAAPIPPYYPDDEVFRVAWARYSDLITQMDAWVGGILDQLAADGLAENTIVVFWSDHGKGMPRAKRWPNESGLREPLIVRWPACIPGGQVREDLVHTMDLSPTMLQMAGLPIPEHMHGIPLIDRDGSRAAKENDYVFGGRDRQGEAEDRSRTARDGRFRYIRHYFPDKPAMIHTQYPDKLATWTAFREAIGAEAVQLARGESPSILTPLQRSVAAQRKPAEELFDIENDPHETTDLAADPRFAPDLERLRAALDGWVERYGDLGARPEAELMGEWRPGGRKQRTEPPHLVRGTAIEATSDTPGAIVAWTTDEPTGTTPANSRLGAEIGAPPQDGRTWTISTGPFAPPEGRTVWARAFRIGYEPSEDVEVRP